MKKSENKIDWQYNRTEESDAIWKGTTEAGGEFWAIKKDHVLTNIIMRTSPKKAKILSLFEQKLNRAKEFVKTLDRSSVFVMYEKEQLYIPKKMTCTEYYNSTDYTHDTLPKLRLKGWTIVAKLVTLDNSVRMEFYSSVCSRKDNFCKQIAIHEAFENFCIYSVDVPYQSFNDNLRLFSGICKGLLIHKIEKKAKNRI